MEDLAFGCKGTASQGSCRSPADLPIKIKSTGWPWVCQSSPRLQFHPVLPHLSRFLLSSISLRCPMNIHLPLSWTRGERHFQSSSLTREVRQGAVPLPFFLPVCRAWISFDFQPIWQLSSNFIIVSRAQRGAYSWGFFFLQPSASEASSLSPLLHQQAAPSVTLSASGSTWGRRR